MSRLSDRRVKGTRIAPVAEPVEESQFGEVAALESNAALASEFRPVQRPPMAWLVVLDDGRDTGETVRLRGARTVIGRSEGDVVIPHDSMISGQHLEIERQQAPDGYRWLLRDLGSTNGTFVRLPRFRLRHNYELILGGNRFRVCLPGGAQVDLTESRSESGTRGWAAISREDLAVLAGPTLIQLDGDEEVTRISLSEDQVIGADRDQSQLAIDDPLLDDAHARLRRKSNGKWYIEDMESVNGVWVRVERSHTSQRCEFQLGEQRFILQVL
jgi:pSer/pThr/pTyr-binding forkhead associated (FHA) protein